MINMKTIVVKIRRGGVFEVDAVGFKGVGCEAATKSIAQAMGSPTGSTKKPERYVQEIGCNKQGVGGGR